LTQKAERPRPPIKGGFVVYTRATVVAVIANPMFAEDRIHPPSAAVHDPVTLHRLLRSRAADLISWPGIRLETSGVNRCVLDALPKEASSRRPLRNRASVSEGGNSSLVHKYVGVPC
jgi:hypothetical protein